MPLAQGVHFLTATVPVHVMDADRSGPTVLIEGGIHGDEVAGVHAIEEMLEEALRPAAGRLIVIPTMNRAAYRARKRTAPGGLDLNRCFPGDRDAPEPEKRLARLLMDLVEDERPDLIATLHESEKRYDPNVTPSFGQSLVYGVEPMPKLIGRAVRRLNDLRQDDTETWAAQYYPVSTSSTEVIVDAIGCIGICVETWMGLPERRRIDMHKDVVRVLFDEIGVLPWRQR